MTGRWRWAAVLAALLGLMLVAGCAWVPTSGRVVEVGPLGPGQEEAGPEFDPSGPSEGESPTGIVEGFLDAMQATPVQTTVAREFLTRNAATTWNPQQGTIVYSTRSRASGSDGDLAVRLSGANELDGRGAWAGQTAAPVLHFSLVREDGEWRISRAPDRMVVPESWFQTRFTQVSLYFFDPSARILVPEPVLLPAGPQLPTELISNLVRGPAPGLADVERTFLPAGVSGGLSVPVVNGLAQVSLSGSADLSDTATRMMAAQITWTLRQVASVQAIHLTVGGRDVTVGTSTQIPIGSFAEFDPAGDIPDRALYGLRGGTAISDVGRTNAPLPGVWGREHADVRRFVMGPDIENGAAVTSNGRGLIVGALTDSARHTYPDVGVDLLRPSWDFADRLWLVDADRGHATVSYLSGGRIRPVEVPGVTGHNVSDFEVSLDGTRLVAVVRGTASDRVVVSRLRQGAHGMISGATRARTISDRSEGPIRVEATAWHSPTEIVTLQQFSGTALIRTLNVDGSTTVYPGVTVTVGDRPTDLVGSPQAGNPLFAVTPGRLLDLSGHGNNLVVPPGVSSIGYVG